MSGPACSSGVWWSAQLWCAELWWSDQAGCIVLEDKFESLSFCLAPPGRCLRAVQGDAGLQPCASQSAAAVMSAAQDRELAGV